MKPRYPDHKIQIHRQAGKHPCKTPLSLPRTTIVECLVRTIFSGTSLHPNPLRLNEIIPVKARFPFAKGHHEALEAGLPTGHLHPAQTEKVGHVYHPM